MEPSKAFKRNHLKPELLYSLNSDYKELILSSSELCKVWKALNNINSCTEQISHYLECYKPELGSALDKIKTSYNQLIEKVLKETLRIQKQQEKIEVEPQEDPRQAEWDQLSQELKQKQLTIKALKKQIEISKKSEEELQREVLTLSQIVEFDEKNQEEEPQENAGKVHKFGPKNLEEVKKIAENVSLDTQLKSFEDTLNKVESEHFSKSQVIKNLNGVIKSMAKQDNKKCKSTQVGEGELYWNVSPVTLQEVPLESKSCLVAVSQVEDLSKITIPQSSDPTNWSLTPKILRFLANTPSRLALVYPFKYFKSLLLEVCSRILSYQTPQLCLDEFLCVYFLEKFGLRRLAEIKLKEFLASLKFYTEKSLLAKLFAKVSGITGDLQNDSDYLMADYNTQVYFLYCLKFMRQDNSALWESSEGVTWIRAEKEQVFTSNLVPWLSVISKKTRSEISGTIKTLKDFEGQSGKFIDLEQLLGVYLREYIAARKNVQKQICKNLSDSDKVHKGLYSFEEFKSLVPKTVTGSKIPRAFYYALTGHQNNFQVSQNSVLGACVRLGLDLPSMEFEEAKLHTRLTESKSCSETKTPSLEKVSALLGQHFSIIRELKKNVEHFNELVSGGSDFRYCSKALQNIAGILSNSVEFFVFPVTF